MTDVETGQSTKIDFGPDAKEEDLGLSRERVLADALRLAIDYLAAEADRLYDCYTNHAGQYSNTEDEDEVREVTDFVTSLRAALAGNSPAARGDQDAPG